MSDSNKSKVGSREVVLAAMRGEGATLVNRGLGWRLEWPPVPYKSAVRLDVSDEVVDSLTSDGIITVAIPFHSAVGTLVEDAK